MKTGLLSRRVLAVCIAVAFLVPASAVARDSGVITLRLEDRQTTRQETPAAVVPKMPQSPSAPPQGSVLPPLAPPAAKGASIVLMDADTGQVLYAVNPHVRRPNASTTKIMTAILFIEHCKMTDKIKASKKASEAPYTSLHLKPGERISARDLLLGMMVRSANDAAVAAAEHVAGSVSKFAAMMNKKAVELGCKNTHFITPNGLHASGHYSSAHDLCLMARYALGLPEFNEAIQTRKHILESRTINRKDLAVFNRSKFMKSYPGADGVKSGYVKQAGYCYVGSATRNGWRLVATVLKSDNASRDTAAVMDYGFGNFERVVVAPARTTCAEAEVRGGDRGAVAAESVRDLRAVVRKGGSYSTRLDLRPVQAPVARGAGVGKMIAVVDGIDAASVDLVAAHDVGISFSRKAWLWAKTCGVVVFCLVVGTRYGAAFAKSSGRRRRRLAASLRDFDRYR